MKQMFSLLIALFLFSSPIWGQEKTWIDQPQRIQNYFGAVGLSAMASNPLFARQAAAFDGRFRLSDTVKQKAIQILEQLAQEMKTMNSRLGKVFKRHRRKLGVSLALSGSYPLRYLTKGNKTYCLVVIPHGTFKKNFQVKIRSMLRDSETLRLARWERRRVLQKLGTIIDSALQKHNLQARWKIEKGKLIYLRPIPMPMPRNDQRMALLEKQVDRLTRRVALLEALLMEQFLREKRLRENLMKKYHRGMLKKLPILPEKNPLPPVRKITPPQPPIFPRQVAQPLAWWNHKGSLSLQGYVVAFVGSQKDEDNDGQSAKFQARTTAMMAMVQFLKKQLGLFFARWNKELAHTIKPSSLLSFGQSEEVVRQIVNSALSKSKVLLTYRKGNTYYALVGLNTEGFLKNIQELMENNADTFTYTNRQAERFKILLKAVIEKEGEKLKTKARYRLTTRQGLAVVVPLR